MRWYGDAFMARSLNRWSSLSSFASAHFPTTKDEICQTNRMEDGKGERERVENVRDRDTEREKARAG